MADPWRTTITTTFPEASTAILTGTIRDGAGNAVPAASLTTLALTLFDRATGTVINSRNAVSILNTNGGTVTSGGVLTLTLSPSDMALVSQSAAQETHVAFLRWTYNAGADAGEQEVVFTVTNLAKWP